MSQAVNRAPAGSVNYPDPHLNNELDAPAAERLHDVLRPLPNDVRMSDARLTLTALRRTRGGSHFGQLAVPLGGDPQGTAMKFCYW